MKKIMFKLFDGLDWIVKHKKINIAFDFLLLGVIIFSTGLTLFTWQFYPVLIAITIMVAKSYGQGRNDESKFNQKLNQKFEQELLKKVDKVISKTGFKLRKVEPKKVVN